MTRPHAKPPTIAANPSAIQNAVIPPAPTPPCLSSATMNGEIGLPLRGDLGILAVAA